MKTFVIGDIHGAHLALKQCLERSKFNKEKDLLITLGDIVDGWSQSYECIEELLTIKNRIDIRGNHDSWFHEFINTGIHGSQWTMGANFTRDSYIKNCDLRIPQTHIDFFDKQVNYYVDQYNRCFVHGGFDRMDSIENTYPQYMYYWDRDLWIQAKSCKGDQRLKTINDFHKIFIGHTHVDGPKNPECLPVSCGGITNLDTGAGWEGKLTMAELIDEETTIYHQSDLVPSLYPKEILWRRG